MGAVLALALVAVLAWLVWGGGGSSAADLKPLGQFAGYTWLGPTRSISGRWRVPRIAPGSTGFASTWIGAESEFDEALFIQLGVAENATAKVHGGRPLYFAFWSDPKQDFHPRLLIEVRAGDLVRARMALSNGFWSLRFRDLTTGRSATETAIVPSSTESLNGPYDLALWVQEDPTSALTHMAEPYPQLSTVAFSGLAVDGAPPHPSALTSGWMGSAGVALAPSPVRDDSFVLAPTTLNAAAARYVAAAAAESPSSVSFRQALIRWTDSTPERTVRTADARFAQGLDREIVEHEHGDWPAGARAAVARVTAAERAVRTLVLEGPRRVPGGVAAWRARVDRAFLLTRREAPPARAALHGPGGPGGG